MPPACRNAEQPERDWPWRCTITKSGNGSFPPGGESDQYTTSGPNTFGSFLTHLWHHSDQNGCNPFLDGGYSTLARLLTNLKGTPSSTRSLRVRLQRRSRELHRLLGGDHRLLCPSAARSARPRLRRPQRPAPGIGNKGMSTANYVRLFTTPHLDRTGRRALGHRHLRPPPSSVTMLDTVHNGLLSRSDAVSAEVIDGNQHTIANRRGRGPR